MLRLAHQAAGLQGDGPAEWWMEVVVSVAHKPFAVLLATVVSDCQVEDGSIRFTSAVH